MVTISKEPAYNLKVVMHETGIKADTLRAWERRYGLPQPARTAGGHRLYSSYDIGMIKWLLARQDEGVRIHQAINLWNSLQESGTDPLVTGQTGYISSQPPVIADHLTGSTLDEIRQEWIRACLSFDEKFSERIVAQAFARYPLETVCLEVFQKGLSEIGAMWFRGESTVQQEHFASALAIRRIDTLISAAPPASRHGRILMGCPAGEEHIFSPLLITLFLRYRGWDVIYLGANVPNQRWDATIQSTNPNLIVLSAQQLSTAASLFEMAGQFNERNIPIAYGGLIFNTVPELRMQIPGHFIGETLADAPANIEKLLSSPSAIPDSHPVSKQYSQLLDEYIEKQPLINAHIWQNTQTNGLKEYHLSLANDFLAQDIKAALQLGDLNYIQPDLKWISQLLTNLEMPSSLLPKYLDLYRQGVAENLKEQGKPITDWLNLMIDSDIQ